MILKSIAIPARSHYIIKSLPNQDFFDIDTEELTLHGSVE